MTVRPFASTILSALLAVLMLVSTASAGCAWVVWHRTNTVVGVRSDGGFSSAPKGGWDIVSAAPTQAECKATAEAMFLENQKDALSTGDTVHLFMCFPDSVDPRGPKAGR
jgi:hypothetical protein